MNFKKDLMSNEFDFDKYMVWRLSPASGHTHSFVVQRDRLITDMAYQMEKSIKSATGGKLSNSKAKTMARQAIDSSTILSIIPEGYFLKGRTKVKIFAGVVVNYDMPKNQLVGELDQRIGVWV